MIQPIQSLTEYKRKSLRARRLGVPYPYELIRMLTPPRGAAADFPAGEFTEYDLAGDELVPVDRPYGRNTAGIVTGVITSYTSLVPEGLRRVAILGDPTSGLGSLAEAECRRIVAAVDLASRLKVPLEWFALSSGARIAWDSGTENMDWIAAVLRSLVEFTQAGGEVNIIVTGINVGAQPYWNAEATMLMHTRGILVMTPASAMVLTGKNSLDLLGRGVRGGQPGHRRLRPDHGPQRRGAVLGAHAGESLRAAVAALRAHLHRPGRAGPAPGADERPDRP